MVKPGFQPSRLVPEAILLNTVKANIGTDEGDVFQNTVTPFSAEEIKTKIAVSTKYQGWRAKATLTPT